MIAVTGIEHKTENNRVDVIENAKSPVICGFSALLTRLKNLATIFRVAFANTGSVIKSLHLLKELGKLQKKVWGQLPRKWAVASCKKYFMLYAPGLPSSHLNRMYQMELSRLQHNGSGNELRFAFFAVTKKCPLNCEHCFEWDKLHSKELLSYDDLRNVVLKLKAINIVQLHLSGGEPMLRVNDIAKLAMEFSNDMEFYVLTSGFNATKKNIQLLKDAGVTGLVVSIDHYDKSIHNTFRGSANSYDDAVNAVKYARECDMLVTLSVCVTRAMAVFNELYNYACFAKDIGASFIQLLEPKKAGRYSGKDVQLSKEQIKTLCNFYYQLNFNAAYSAFPIVVYHGYYQKQVGCFSAGNRSVYIDTNADVLFCPFCHQKSGNILNGSPQEIIPLMQTQGCPTYGNAKF